ncbi:MAG: hypothetical protein K1000chlam2_00908 [Chlamydiae bacterium]|nr:hypothetical protein [Chlamydiota bacterium]
MVVHLDSNKSVQQSVLSTQMSHKVTPQNHIHDTLVSNKENKVTEYFYKAWDTVKWAFSSAWSWVAWLFQGCPVESSKLEILEEILEAPKDTGKEFAKKAKESIGELVGAILDDPIEFKSLMEKEGNKEKFADFLKAFKGNIEDGSGLFAGRSVLSAFQALYQGRSYENAIFKSLLGLLKDNIPLLCKVLENVRSQVLNTVGTNSNDESISNERAALIGVFGTYLPKVIQTAAKDNSESLRKLIDVLYEQTSFVPNQIPDLINTHLHPTPSNDELAFLNACFQNGALTLRQLSDSHVLTQNADSPSLDLRQTLYRECIKAMEPEHFTKLREIVEKNSKLGGEIFKQIEAMGATSEGREKLSRNLSKALPILSKLHEDYQK